MALCRRIFDLQDDANIELQLDFRPDNYASSQRKRAAVIPEDWNEVLRHRFNSSSDNHIVHVVHRPRPGTLEVQMRNAQKQGGGRWFKRLRGALGQSEPPPAYSSGNDIDKSGM